MIYGFRIISRQFINYFGNEFVIILSRTRHSLPWLRAAIVTPSRLSAGIYMSPEQLAAMRNTGFAKKISSFNLSKSIVKKSCVPLGRNKEFCLPTLSVR